MSDGRVRGAVAGERRTGMVGGRMEKRGKQMLRWICALSIRWYVSSVVLLLASFLEAPLKRRSVKRQRSLGSVGLVGLYTSVF